jgi:hypothetical protein
MNTEIENPLQNRYFLNFRVTCFDFFRLRKEARDQGISFPIYLRMKLGCQEPITKTKTKI